jgi:hypothetical protein
MSEKVNAYGTVIDVDKVQRMLQKIVMREKTNLKTKEKNDGQMAQMIKKND